MKDKIRQLLAEMTVDEKLTFLAAHQPALPRLGIPEFFFGGEAAHGVEARHDQGQAREHEPTTVFPQPIGMSASWDTELIEKAGQVVGTEARALYNRNKTGGLCRFAPTVDMERDPRWGRTEEGYGEDPLLVGKMASGYVNGMQGRDETYIRMAAAMKHFYANNVEEGRGYKSSTVDPRNKYEYYLPPFEKVVKEGRVESMMTAYNKINGVPGLVNPEVQKLVRDDWGLKGYVVCDGGAMSLCVNAHHYFGIHAETIAAAIRAGVDCFLDPADTVEKAAREAYELGMIEEKDLDRALTNCFATRMHLGAFAKEGENPFADASDADVNTSAARAVCRKLTQESAVLLKNENGFLPLDPQKEEKIAVIGPWGDLWLKDWYGGIPLQHTSLLKGIENALGRKVLFETGLPEGYIKSGSGYLGLDEEGRLVVNAAKENALCLIRNNWGRDNVTLCDRATGRFVVYAEEENRFVLGKTEVFGWFVKERFGLKETPEGTWQMNTWNGRRIAADEQGHLLALSDGEEGEQLTVLLEDKKSGLAEAAALAAAADKVIFMAGCNPVLCAKEEIDRHDLDLPPVQDALLRRVYEANPDTVLVMMTNYPYTIGWAQEHVPAILQMATGSQELGDALADILFGKAVPSGKLPLTWYRSMQDLADMDDYDIIKGKRTYRYFEGDVLYPFGYGLSYTTFECSDLQVRVEENRLIAADFTVTNTGNTAGDQVVQLYASRKSQSRIKHPQKQLINFARVRNIAAGESRHVHMEVPVRELAVYDVVRSRKIVEEGIYRIYVGGSSADQREAREVSIPGEKNILRDALKWTMADHYDDYENIRLDTSGAGMTCALPLDCAKQAVLEYRDFDAKKLTRQMTVNLQCAARGSVAVLINGKRAADWSGEGVEKYSHIVLPLEEALDGQEEKADIQLVAEGDVRITRFRFEKDK